MTALIDRLVQRRVEGRPDLKVLSLKFAMRNVRPMLSVSITFQHQQSPAFSTTDEATISSLRTSCISFRGDVSDEYLTPVRELRGWLVEAGRPLWADALGKREDCDVVWVRFSRP